MLLCRRGSESTGRVHAVAIAPEWSAGQLRAFGVGARFQERVDIDSQDCVRSPGNQTEVNAHFDGMNLSSRAR